MSVWRDDFVKVNEYTRPGAKLNEVRKIVVHYTANPGASAANHQRYFNGTCIDEKRYASAHIFVDKSEAVCIVPLNEVAYHANDVQKRVNGAPYRGVEALKPNANFLSVGVELCIEKDETFAPQTVERAVEVVAELCKRFGLGAGDIVRHYDVTSKYCPGPWVDSPAEFEAFKQSVAAKLSGASSTVVKASAAQAPAPTPAGGIIGTVRVIATNLNIRSGPGTQYASIGKAPKGKVYNVTANVNDWHRVILADNDNTEAWVFGNNGEYLELVR